jgi:hypothetical protein
MGAVWGTLVHAVAFDGRKSAVTDRHLRPSVGSSHIEGRGVEYGTCFASSKKNENLNLSTSVAHTKKVLPYF